MPNSGIPMPLKGVHIMVATINPDASIIPDDAEVWIQSKASVDAAGGIANVMPATVDEDPAEKGWGYTGLVDAKKGIPLDPSGELKEFDGFGHAAYRSKFSKGKVKSGFTCLEDNAVTSGIVLPGSGPGKVGVPRDLPFYVLYRVIDEGYSETILVSLRPATLELKSHSGYVEGEQTMYEFVAHHAADSKKDVFEKIGGVTSGPTSWTATQTGAASGDTFTLTVDGQSTTALAYNATASAVKAALELLSTVGSGNSTVNGTAGGPYSIALANGGTLSATGTYASGSIAVVAA